MTVTRTFTQGTQHDIGDALVGLMMAGLKDGVLTARFLIRGEGEPVITDVAVGHTVDVDRHHRLRLTSVDDSSIPPVVEYVVEDHPH